MFMVLRTQSRYQNHQSRGNLNQNKLDRFLSDQPIECVSETESEDKEAFKWQDKCLLSSKHPTKHFSFKFYTIILIFEKKYLMIF